MGNINTSYTDRVRYILTNIIDGSLIIQEPIGWEDDEKELARNEEYHGIFAKFSNNLKFIGDAKAYIELIDQLQGINADIRLVKEERHPKTDLWTRIYDGYLDLSTIEIEGNELTIRFNSGGLEQMLKSREGQKIELDRNTTLDGFEIDELEPINVELEGRRIFLKTTYKEDLQNNLAVLSNVSNGNTRGCTVPFPIILGNQSHECAHSPIPGTYVLDNSWERNGPGEVGLMFFAVSDRRRVLNIKFTVSFRVVCTQFEHVNSFAFHCRVAQYQGGNLFLHKSSRPILYIPNIFEGINNDAYSFSFNQQIVVEQGDSLALVFDQIASLGNDFHDGHLDINVVNPICKMTIEEDSFFEKSNTKALLIHDVMDRITTIISNKKKVFKSDFLGRKELGYPADGKGALLAITHGFWVRGFDKLPLPLEGPPKIENLFKPLTTCFKDAMTSLDAIMNVGIGIEKNGYEEIVRLEELSYFYNKNVTIRLPNQIKKVKRTQAISKYYSSIEVGYEMGGNYEEACGLDEYNIKSTYSTVITKIKNAYTKISKFRADMYGLEFARRKPKALNNTQDTPYDNNVFWLDLKRGITALFEQRKWEDDLEIEPKGIFSPETATNLRLSPLNCLMRHGWVISTSLLKYLSNYISYGSSEANSKLKTKLQGKPEYAENGNIINSELDPARFDNWIIEFEHECDFSVMEMVNGSSVILGKKILNIYGLIEFTNEKNELEKGWLLNLKPNKQGSWKVIKANR